MIMDLTPFMNGRPTQIFWNCVAIETVVQFMWSQTSATTVCDDETFEANATTGLLLPGQSRGRPRLWIGHIVIW